MTEDPKEIWAGLGEVDQERLGDLIVGYDQAVRVDERYRDRGVSPLDCGGHDGSDHSYRLTKLVRLGLAEHKKGGGEWGQSSRRYRGSKKYRPTPLGRSVYEARKAVS